MSVKAFVALRLEHVVERAVERVLRAELDPRMQELTDRLEATRAELAEVRAELARTRAAIAPVAEGVAAVPDQIERVHHRVEMHELRSRRDVFAANERAAVASSGRYAAEHFVGAKYLPNPDECLRHALSAAPSGGLALEFGVFRGLTLRVIADVRADERVYGFDSFEGLPEDWRIGFPAGAFDAEGLPDVPGAQLVVGWFDEVLPDFLAEHEGVIDFLHMDGDLYSSAVTVLEHAGPRLRAGSVIVFDEYYNFEGWERGEHLAWKEYVARTGIEFEYLGYVFDNEQVSVRITSVPWKEHEPLDQARVEDQGGNLSGPERDSTAAAPAEPHGKTA